jgi:hypothetical protein
MLLFFIPFVCLFIGWLVASWYHQLLGGDSYAQFLYNGMPLVSSATTAHYTTILKCAVIYIWVVWQNHHLYFFIN